jgi:biopolymer transport protein TolQ
MPNFLAQATTETAVETGFLTLVSRMDLVSHAVLIILVLFSVASWAIILEKWRIISRARRQNRNFLHVFRQSTKFTEVMDYGKRLPYSPLVGLFHAGYSELRYQLGVAQVSHLEAAVSNPGATAAKGRVRIQNLDGINRALLRASSVEVNKLERSLNFLATTAGACPFIGLFGTVWGVFNAFQGIGAEGSTSLATVAPGIAEALIATAAGLFAAIPALVGYNFLLNKIKVISSDMDDFSLEFISVTERSFIDNVPLQAGGTSERSRGH